MIQTVVKGFRPPDKSAYSKIVFFLSYFSIKAYVVGTQKNRLNETVLFSSSNISLIDG